MAREPKVFRRRFQYMIGFGLLASTPLVLAAVYQGTVVNVAPFNGKVHIVVANGNFDGSPGACPSGNAMIYGIDPNTAYGRAMVSVALTAKVTGRLVWAVGDANCEWGSPFGQGEGLSGLDLKG